MPFKRIQPIPKPPAPVTTVSSNSLASARCVSLPAKIIQHTNPTKPIAAASSAHTMAIPDACRRVRASSSRRSFSMW